MFPVDHNFHSFVDEIEESMKKNSKTKKQNDLVDLVMFKIKSELFKAEAEGMNFLLPILKTENKIALYMIPSIKEVNVGLVEVDLKAKSPLKKELEMIAIVYGYSQDSNIHFNANLAQVLCSLHTSYEHKLRLLVQSDIDN